MRIKGKNGWDNSRNLVRGTNYMADLSPLSSRKNSRIERFATPFLVRVPEQRPILLSISAKTAPE
jgi:hypothetical protein